MGKSLVSLFFLTRGVYESTDVFKTKHCYIMPKAMQIGQTARKHGQSTVVTSVCSATLSTIDLLLRRNCHSARQQTDIDVQYPLVSPSALNAQQASTRGF